VLQNKGDVVAHTCRLHAVLRSRRYVVDYNVPSHARRDES